MRKLIVQQYMTVDGFAADIDGGMSFVDAKPFDESSDETFKAAATAFVDTVDTMLIGANTYNMFTEYWPTATAEGAFADKINSLRKLVASTTLKSAPWGSYEPATITNDPVETIRNLKEQPGKDIVVWGSLTLCKTLFEAGLVDEVQLRVCPVTIGAGRSVFPGTLNLELIGFESFERSLAVHRYAVRKA